MKCLRTPNERFANLPGYAFAPHYIEDLPGYEGVRVHYLDEGKDTGKGVALCLHGNPAWSYLYRKMIPVFTAAGLRVVAPDLIGFGRSDKPAEENAHSFAFHRGMLQQFVQRLNLQNVLLVVQDWGGIFGLTLPPLMPERFTRLLVMNTALAVGKDPGEGFKQWRAYSNSQPDLPVGRLIGRGKPDMTPQEMAAYDAPFPDATYKAALRRFPNMVPDQPDVPGAAESRAAADWWRTQWKGESFMAIGMQDPVLGPPWMRQLHKLFTGCPAPMEIAEGGHFVQEWGEPIAQAALRHFKLA
jgi:haloalkane dehalogenase